MAVITAEAPKGKVWSVCPTCKEGRWLRPADALRAAQCRRCHLSEIAPLGYAATTAKYGEKVAVRHQQQYRLSHPSNLEQIVAAWLAALGVPYQREVWFEAEGGKVYLLDFVIAGRIVLEVQGDWAHSFHQQRDSNKLRALLQSGCFLQIVLLDEADIHSGAAFERVKALAWNFRTLFS